MTDIKNQFSDSIQDRYDKLFEQVDCDLFKQVDCDLYWKIMHQVYYNEVWNRVVIQVRERIRDKVELEMKLD